MNHLRLAAFTAAAILVSACHRDDPKPEGETHHGADAAPAAQNLADVQPDGTSAPLLHGIGPLHVPISTKSEQAQKYFDQGFTLMYGFNHAEAIRSFKEAARLDPTCGICWWGVALSYGPNINAPMTHEAVPLAWQALQTAQSLRANESPQEQAYIDAVAARYSESGEGRATLDRAYADAMAKLVAAYPDDLERGDVVRRVADGPESVGLLPARRFAETRNRDCHRATRTRSKRPIRNIPARCTSTFTRSKRPPTPERAEVAADELGDLVPVAGHLVHMPAHIYLRVGRYHDAVTANELAATADEDYIAQCNAQGFYPAVYYPHNLHFLWYAAMMEGQKKLSLDTGAQDGAARAARFRALHTRGSAVPAGADLHAGPFRYVGRHARPNPRRPTACRSQPRCGTTDAALRSRTRAISQTRKQN